MRIKDVRERLEITSVVEQEIRHPGEARCPRPAGWLSQPKAPAHHYLSPTAQPLWRQSSLKQTFKGLLQHLKALPQGKSRLKPQTDSLSQKDPQSFKSWKEPSMLSLSTGWPSDLALSPNKQAEAFFPCPFPTSLGGLLYDLYSWPRPLSGTSTRPPAFSNEWSAGISFLHNSWYFRVGGFLEEWRQAHASPAH